MLSWRLFRALNIYTWPPARLRRIYHLQRYHVMTRGTRLDRGAGIAAVVGVVIVFLFGVWTTQGFDTSLICLLPVCVFGAFLVLLPAMPVWILPLSVTLAPAVAAHRQRGTWDLLRITPLESATLLCGIARAALERLRPLLNGLLVALATLGIVFGIVFVQALLPPLNDLLNEPEQTTLAGIGALLWFAGGMLLFVDRVQQLLLIGIGALAGGTWGSRAESSQPVRAATLAGALLALVLWLVEILANAALIWLLPGVPQAKRADILISLFAGPLPGYFVALPVDWALLAIAIMLLLREIALRVVWSVALYAARR